MINSRPDYIFETSWEVCNKMGGIHTVLASKAKTLVESYKNNLIFIGPDIIHSDNKNLEFIHEPELFSDWVLMLNYEGLRARVGRWNIPGKPVAILVDFSSLVSEKDQILASLWETYKVDSLYGHWDYVESVLFGHAAGLVVESFYKHYLSTSDKVVAHFNEWMTGSGALYLKRVLPQVGTVFTTHATTIGRSIAGNGLPLYDNIKTYNADDKAQQLGVVAKHSIEKQTALNVDAFTTVSEITANECKYFLGREVDVVTPNGFENNFVPKDEEYITKKDDARKSLLKVGSALLGCDLNPETLLVASSGRYEYKNKGTDMLLDTLKKVDESYNGEKEIVCFVLIPANIFGPRKDLIERLNNKYDDTPLANPYLTHGLNDIGYDPIINRLQEIHLNNNRDDKVKLIFVPSYLHGDDGIFNKPYYDLLIGIDLTIFPSYYEPWGYTPLESIAFGVPTVTTTLAGFGIWALQYVDNINGGVSVIPRNDHNYHEGVSKIAEVIIDVAQKSDKERDIIRSKAFELSNKLEWHNLIDNYYKTYNIALNKVENRKDSYVLIQNRQQMRIENLNTEPIWKNLTVKSKLPERIDALQTITRNLWWTWNYEAIELFEYIDNELWEDIKNPVQLLEKVSYDRFKSLTEDKEFLAKFDKVKNDFDDYMAKPFNDGPSIAYFSMEYGINDVLKIFSGGLGVLAGDYLKEASDKGVNITAIGLMYRYGYFKQTLSVNGEQIAEYEMQDFLSLPIEEVRDNQGNKLYIDLELPGRTLKVGVWKAQVGRIPLYLLDTDIVENSHEDQEITHMLYGGNWENRLKQEILLGIGGIRLLNKLEEKPDLYHCNEGHAALINVERLVNYTEQKVNYAEAMELVRASSLFTTHTPVPAGHDKFDEDMFRTYMRHIPEKLNLSWNEFMELGREGGIPNEKFSMSILAAKTSQEVNGVSWLHGEVTKGMFQNLYKGFFPEELFINYVTNGVHYSTWTSREVQNVYDESFGKGFKEDIADVSNWEKIHEVEDEKIWNARKKLKQKLTGYIRRRMGSVMLERHEDPSHIVDVLDAIREDALTIGFARRFATYKRAHLLFKDINRLNKILNNPEKPVQFIFAGKAHPADGAGQDLIKDIVEISKRPEFVGKIIFLENYDMSLGKRLISGVDVWLNTPTRPLEASGTSGEKAVMNGVLNFSVKDGWWYEGYKEGAGWALTEKRAFENQGFQDELDAITIYSILENEIIPLYYDRNEKGIPTGWLKYVKNNIAQIAPEFTTRRMINDYEDRFYSPMFERITKLRDSDNQLAKDIALWKRRVLAGWNYVEVKSIVTPKIGIKELGLGEVYEVEVVIDHKALEDVEFGIEMLMVEAAEEQSPKIVHSEPFEVVKREGSLVTYVMKYKLNLPGSYKFGIRLYPHNENLPHKQDFNLVRWI